MIIYPPNEGYKNLLYSDQVVFLAGPIQGAADWQSTAERLLHDNFISTPLSESEFSLVVANPRARGWHKDYDGQVKWETAHLEFACWTGVIMVWCAKEQTHFCERPHGQTTRFELGEWVGKKQVLWASEGYKVRLVVGIEPGFPNEKYIRTRLGSLWPEMKIPATLEDACELAIDELIAKQIIG